MDPAIGGGARTRTDAAPSKAAFVRVIRVQNAVRTPKTTFRPRSGDASFTKEA